MPHTFAVFECVGNRQSILTRRVLQSKSTPTHSKCRNEWGTRHYHCRDHPGILAECEPKMKNRSQGSCHDAGRPVLAFLWLRRGFLLCDGTAPGWEGQTFYGGPRGHESPARRSYDEIVVALPGNDDHRVTGLLFKNYCAYKVRLKDRRDFSEF